jgi:hypothetical protein
VFLQSVRKQVEPEVKVEKGRCGIREKESY